MLFALVVHSVGVSEYGHYTAQAQESLFNFGGTKEAVLILGRSVNEYVGDIITTIKMCSACGTSTQLASYLYR